MSARHIKRLRDAGKVKGEVEEEEEEEGEGEEEFVVVKRSAFAVSNVRHPISPSHSLSLSLTLSSWCICIYL